MYAGVFGDLVQLLVELDRRPRIAHHDLLVLGGEVPGSAWDLVILFQLAPGIAQLALEQAVGLRDRKIRK